MGLAIRLDVEVGEALRQELIGPAYGVGVAESCLCLRDSPVEVFGVGVVVDGLFEGDQGLFGVVLLGEAGELGQGIGGVPAEAFAFGFGPLEGEVVGGLPGVKVRDQAERIKACSQILR